MPGSKSGLACPRTKGHENDGTVSWCKHVCRFPNPRTTDPVYKTWRDAVFARMQQDRIRSRALATPEQWAAIQAYGLSLEPLASNGRAALWQQDSSSGRRFTECFDYLLKDIAKKHIKMLRRLGVALPPAVPAAPAVAANNRKFRPLIIRINVHVKVLI
jgi:hypothetical protein